MKFTRDTWLAIGLIVVLVLMTLVAASRQGENSLPALTSISAAPNGALALKLWLTELDYPVLEDLLTVYELPKTAKVALILQPMQFTPDELTTLAEWVEAGGTLIAAGDSFGMVGLGDHFDIAFSVLDAVPEKLDPQTPLFLNPVIEASTQPRPLVYLVPSRKDYVTLIATQGRPVMISFEVGQGRVLFASTAHPFSNAGLKQSGNPALVLNLLGLVKQSGPVWFDEWHHGFRKVDQALGPENWLRYTPLGRSLLFVAAVIFLALLLQSSGFGRPVPLPRELRRRGALEHVTALANLSRLAGHRRSILQQYRHEIKRNLGRRYRLDPALPDSEYVAALARYNPTLDIQSLSTLLHNLDQPNFSESDLVRLAAEATKWIKE